MSKLARVAWVCCVLGLPLLGGSTARSEETVKSNLDVMSSLTAEVADELVSGFPTEATPGELKLSPVGTDERYGFIWNILAKSLTSKGYRVHVAVSPTPSDSTGLTLPPVDSGGYRGLNLEYQVIDFTLRYPEIYRSHLIGGKKVKRSAAVRVLARLVNPADGLIVWTGEATRSYDDAFSYGSVEEVEAGLYAFTKPPRESRKWGRVIEPVVVSGIIVGLIYLFFSNQGD